MRYREATHDTPLSSLASCKETSPQSVIPLGYSISHKKLIYPQTYSNSISTRILKENLSLSVSLSSPITPS